MKRTEGIRSSGRGVARGTGGGRNETQRREEVPNLGEFPMECHDNDNNAAY